MRNLLERVKQLEQSRVKEAAQKIYAARDRKAARAAFLRFKLRSPGAYPKQLDRDLPEILTSIVFKSLFGAS
jgi:transposase-like protein